MTRQNMEHPRWVFLMDRNVKVEANPENTSNIDKGAAEILCLTHPRYGNGVQFLLDGEKCLYEIQKMSEKGENKHSGTWVVNQRVIPGGEVYLATKYNPLFLVLPALTAYKEKLSPLEQILEEKKLCFRWLCTLVRPQLTQICDVDDRLGPKNTFYKINEEKVLLWLQKKVENVVEVLVKKEIAAESSAEGPVNLSSQSIQQNKENVNKEKEERRRKRATVAAFQVIAENIDEAWTQKLADKLKLTLEEGLSKKRKLSGGSHEQAHGDGPDHLRFMAGASATMKQTAVKAKTAMTAGQRKLAKTDTRSMKSMMSFFKKK